MVSNSASTPRLFRTKWNAWARAWPPFWALGAVLLIVVPLGLVDAGFFYLIYLDASLLPDMRFLIFAGAINVFVLALGGFWFASVFFAVLRMDAAGIVYRVPFLPALARLPWEEFRSAYLVFDGDRLVRAHLWRGKKGQRAHWTRLSVYAFAEPERVERAVLLAIAAAGIPGKTFTRDPKTLRALRLTQLALVLVVVVGGVTAAWWRLPAASAQWVTVRVAVAGLMGFAGCAVRVPMRRRDRWTLVLWGVLYAFFVTMQLRDHFYGSRYLYIGPAWLWETVAEVALAASAAWLGTRIYWPVRTEKELVVTG